MKNRYLTLLENLRHKLTEVGMEQEVVEQTQKIASDIECFEVIIPVVGAFSAGKTSLINSFLQRDKKAELPVDTLAQTAIATEIRSAAPGQNEYIDLCDNDSCEHSKKIDLEEYKNISTGTLKTEKPKWLFARAFLQSERLSLSDNKILVDMPGLDSGLRTHNNAILRYLPRGSFFILVIDAENASLRRSELIMLQEHNIQGFDFAVLINKIEKKEQDRDEIISHITEQIKTQLNIEAPVYAVSTRKGETGIHGMLETYQNIDCDRALQNFYYSVLIQHFDSILQLLHARYSGLNLDSAESDEIIEELQKQKEQAIHALQEQTRDIERKYSNTAVDKLLRALRERISEAAPMLAESYSGDGESLKRELNEIVRFELTHLLTAAREETSREIMESISEQMQKLDAAFERLVTPENTTVSNISATLENIVPAMRKVHTGFSDVAQKITNRDVQASYLAISGTLAAATAVIAPWLEVIIIMLPTIIGILSKGAREEQERKQKQKIETEIKGSVASRITSELRSEVSKTYREECASMIHAVQQQLSGNIEAIEKELKQAREQRNVKEAELEAQREQLSGAIESISSLKQSIQAQ